MKIKTSELTGAALDWAVATVEGRKPSSYKGTVRATAHPHFPDSPPMFGPELNYSTDWAQGGPIIERELHNVFKWNQLDPKAPELWCGVHNRKTDSGIYAINMDGPTPLIAAMRCFVASRLGDEVEVPDELG